jgi:hypothetical protein
MKTITKKILESGLIPKHTAALMERWRQLDPGAADMVNTESLLDASSDALVKFVDEIDELMTKDREDYREARLEVRGFPILVKIGPGLTNPIAAFSPLIVVFRDEVYNPNNEFNTLIFPTTANEHLKVGAVVLDTKDDFVSTVEDITPLYLDETVYGYQVVIKKIS